MSVTGSDPLDAALTSIIIGGVAAQLSFAVTTYAILESADQGTVATFVEDIPIVGDLFVGGSTVLDVLLDPFPGVAGALVSLMIQEGTDSTGLAILGAVTTGAAFTVLADPTSTGLAGLLNLLP